VDKATTHGATPLMVAARNGRAETVRALLEAMGDGATLSVGAVNAILASQLNNGIATGSQQEALGGASKGLLSRALEVDVDTRSARGGRGRG
jgi:ankyrin repeat protein